MDTHLSWLVALLMNLRVLDRWSVCDARVRLGLLTIQVGMPGSKVCDVLNA